MAAEAARILEYPDEYYSGSAAPVYNVPEPDPSILTVPQEEAAIGSHAGTRAYATPTVSLFSVFGGLVAAFLMVTVLIANIRYNEVSSERLRLETQLTQLTEMERRLEIEFESFIDMKAVEQYARDVLGMSKPDTEQISIVNGLVEDKVEKFESNDDGLFGGFGEFIRSLMGYLKIGD